jgi:hypothetical protein
MTPRSRAKLGLDLQRTLGVGEVDQAIVEGPDYNLRKLTDDQLEQLRALRRAAAD